MNCESCNSDRLRFYHIRDNNGNNDRFLKRYRCRECGNDDYAD